MRCSFANKISVFFLFLFPTLVFAESLVDISSNLSSPVANIIYALIIMSFIISIGFAIGTLFLWRRHRENPVHVPLSQVFFSFIMALLCGLVPYLSAKFNGYDFFKSDSRQDAYLAEQLSKSNNHTPPPSNASDGVLEDKEIQKNNDSPPSKPLWEE